jgi:hypothetical protein
MAVTFIRQLTKLVEPLQFAQLPTGCDRDIGQQDTLLIVQVVNTMEPEESLVADVRGNWTPRQVVEKRLTALLYAHRPGSLSRTHDREWVRRRFPVNEQ